MATRIRWETLGVERRLLRCAFGLDDDLPRRGLVVVLFADDVKLQVPAGRTTSVTSSARESRWRAARRGARRRCRCSIGPTSQLRPASDFRDRRSAKDGLLNARSASRAPHDRRRIRGPDRRRSLNAREHLVDLPDGHPDLRRDLRHRHALGPEGHEPVDVERHARTPEPGATTTSPVEPRSSGLQSGAAPARRPTRRSRRASSEPARRCRATAPCKRPPARLDDPGRARSASCRPCSGGAGRGSRRGAFRTCPGERRAILFSNSGLVFTAETFSEKVCTMSKPRRDARASSSGSWFSADCSIGETRT